MKMKQLLKDSHKAERLCYSLIVTIWLIWILFFAIPSAGIELDNFSQGVNPQKQGEYYHANE